MQNQKCTQKIPKNTPKIPKKCPKMHKQYYVNTSDIDIIVNEKYKLLSKKKVMVKAQALLLPNLQHSI
jgi:hypothetical protein